MGRLIDADDLKKRIKCGILYAGELMCIIDDCKSVDAEPVRHGKWIFGETNGNSWMKCSECLKSQSGQTACFTYCSNCDTKMDKE